jgi:deazaflavin-dependent oxidoreductase (nitroreductase family)
MTQQLDDWNTRNIKEFRANAGKLGGPFAGAPVLLITHPARSPAPRTNPLVYLPEGETMYIFASKGGASTNPDWYHNLLANPARRPRWDGDVRGGGVGGDGEERARVYARQSELRPQFAQYQANTSRKIPVLALRRKA